MQIARHAAVTILLALLSFTAAVPGLAQEPQIPFEDWLAALITEAREQGIREDIIEQALVSVTPIPQVINNDRSQAEFTETFEQYLEKRVTQWRIDTGRARLVQHRELLERVGAQYGVEPRFIVAFWGVETNYGNFTGGTDVIRALVTLAYDPRRSEYFRRELLSALQILNEGHIIHADMKGSWAGAMGQSQFMPSSFLQYAQDFDGDGRRDIWTTEADVFASIAQYLKGADWRDDQTWGREVQLPVDYHARAEQWRQPPAEHSCSVVRHHSLMLPLSQWQEIGVRRADGTDLPSADFVASIILPDGEDGRAFLTYQNFRAILRYNCANNYALSIGHLADRLEGY